MPSRTEEHSSTSVDAQARQVFEFWQGDTGHAKAKLDAKRKRRIKARLKDGFTVEELCAAIRNRRNDPWLMGKDAKSTRVFDGIETLLRDTAQVERLRDLKTPQRNGTSWQGQPGSYQGNGAAEYLASEAGTDPWGLAGGAE